MKDHLTVCIKEMQIHRIVCPVCGLPDLRDETEAALYFNNLDIMVRHSYLFLVKQKIVVTCVTLDVDQRAC